MVGMTDIAHVIAGEPLSEEHTRVTEAYLREHDMPMSGHHFTAAVVNEAVDWWNTGAPDAPAASEEFLADLASPIRLEPSAIPIRDGGRPR